MKKAASILLCLSMLLALCACGSGEAEPTTGNPVATGSAHASQTDTNPEADGGEYTLSEYLATGETIWFELDGVNGKDSKVAKFYVLEPDGSAYYAKIPGYTLGDVEQMEDSEIAAMVKETYTDTYATAWHVLPGDNEQEQTTQLAQTLYSLLLSVTDFQLLQTGGDEVGTFTPDKQACLEAAASRGMMYDVYQNIVESEWEALVAAYDEWSAMCNSLENKESVMMLMYGGYLTESLINEELLIGQTEMGIEEGWCSEADAALLQTTYAAMREIIIPAAERGVRMIAETIEERRANPELAQYKLVIITDSTGNNTESMLFVHNIPTELTLHLDETELHWYTPAAGGSGNSVVYDSEYNGYWINNGAFFTRLNGDIQLVLDQVGECDLPIDVEDTRTLFE